MYEQIVTDRAVPVVTPEQLSSFGRFDMPQQYVDGSSQPYTDDYQLLLTFIEAATDEIESTAATACINEQILLTFDYFPGQADPRQEASALSYAYATNLNWYGFPTLDSIEVVRRPLLADPAPVIKYYDTTGTLQTLDPSTYTVACNKITLNVGQTWPLTDRRQDCVQITYTAGYSADDPTQVPARLTMAILYLANHFANVRQVITVEPTSEVNFTLCRMLRTFRSMRVPR
jgi:hypothetical protein